MTNYGDIIGSKTKGSKRQLFHTGNDDCNLDDFFLRPSENRNVMGFANTIGDMQSFGNTIADHTSSLIMRLDNSCNADNFKYTSEYSYTSTPAVITNCTNDWVWPANGNNWSIENLRNLLGSEKRFEVAQCDATVSLDNFFGYMESVEAALDDNPVYVFETLVDGEHDDIINKFQIPHFFTNMTSNRSGCHTPGDTSDLLSAAGENGLDFGIHRWLLIGPARSGSNLHVDPLGTSAWNTLLVGSKLWTIFPPNIPESQLSTMGGTENMSLFNATNITSDTTPQSQSQSQFGQTGSHASQAIPDFCAAAWFLNFFPLIQRNKQLGGMQFVQHVGETVFVPAGWHHAVLNLEATVCVTQNIALPCDYLKVSSCLYQEKETRHLVDEWRMSLKRNWCDRTNLSGEAVSALETNKMKQLIHAMTTICVHCGLSCGGNQFELLDDRPVCSSCETSLDAYLLISETDVSSKYNIQLRKLAYDDIPPCVVKVHPRTGRNKKYYLLDHILSMLDT